MKSNRYNPFPLATMVSHYELGPVFWGHGLFLIGGWDAKSTIIHQQNQPFINHSSTSERIIDERLTNQ